MGHLRSDLRLAVRLLLRDRVFTAVAVITLAIGIGATTAVASVAYQVMLQPLPYPQPDRLVRLWVSLSPKDPVARPRLSERTDVPYDTFLEWRARRGSFDAMEGLALGSSVLLGSGVPEQVQTARVTDGLLPLLGVRSAVGGGFSGGQAESPQLMLTDALWRRRFAGDPKVIGTTVSLDGELFTVVGVLPPGFAFATADVWLPLVRSPQDVPQKGPWLGRVVARLRSGVTLERARAELDRLEDDLRAAHPEQQDYTGIAMESWRAQLVGDASESLGLIAGVVLLLLLIACVNVASLLLARASARAQEVSVRAALGASGRRLFTQFLVESALLSALGAAAGVLFATWAVDLLRLFVPRGVVPDTQEGLQLQPAAIGVAVAAAVVTTLLFGVVPALRASRADALSALARGGRGATGRGRLRAVMVSAQVALALAPLVGAGLMLRTLHALSEVPLGFDPAGVTVGELRFGPPRYDWFKEEAAAERQAVTALEERVASLGGVEAAGVVSAVPFGGRDSGSWVDVEGDPESASKGVAGFRSASTGYFQAMRIPLRAGRFFGPEDRAGGADVALVNASFAKRYFGTQDPIGRRIRLGGEKDGLARYKEIVGVVGDIRHKNLEGEPNAEMYFPPTQFVFRRVFVVVRSLQATSALSASLREQVAAVDAELPLIGVRPMTAYVERETEQRSVLGALFAVLAGIGVVLAMVGVYGVAAYAVTQRTRELAIRMALGARPGQVARLVVRQGVVLASIGVVVGLVGAFAVAHALRGVLYGIPEADPLTFGTLPAALLAVASLASWLPARRVLQLDPQDALRAE